MRSITTPGKAQLVYLEAGDTLLAGDVYLTDLNTYVVGQPNGVFSAGHVLDKEDVAWYAPRRYIPTQE